jgi:hypothetical protein
VIITGLSSAPLQWPRCCAVDVGGHPGLLVTEELLRAIRTERALALRCWFGVSGWVVWTWRKAFVVGRFGTEGSLRLHQHSSRAGAMALTRHHWTAAERQERHERALRLRLVRHAKKGYAKRWGEQAWRAEAVALLGTMPDAELAAQLGKTSEAVRRKRSRRGILRFPERRRGRNPGLRGYSFTRE